MNAAVASVEHVAAYAYAHGAEHVSSRRDVYTYQQTEWVNGPEGVKSDSRELVTRDDAAYDTVTARWAHGGVVVATIADGCAVVDIESGDDGTVNATWVAAYWRGVIEEQETTT